MSTAKPMGVKETLKLFYSIFSHYHTTQCHHHNCNQVADGGVEHSDRFWCQFDCICHKNPWHTLCFAQSLNPIVKSLLTPLLVWMLCIIGLERLLPFFFLKAAQAQKRNFRTFSEQMNQPFMKPIQEVETRKNSTFLMLQQLFPRAEAVGAALATPLSSVEYEPVSACLKELAPFHRATVELSEEKRVSGSKMIPMTKMLTQYLFDIKICHTAAKYLGPNLVSAMENKFDNIKPKTALSLATLLDPRFKLLDSTIKAMHKLQWED